MNTKSQNPEPSGWFSRVFHDFKKKKSDKQIVYQAIDEAVELADSKIRSAGKYRQTLYPVMEKLMQYNKELVAAIPNPIALSKQEYGVNPTVRSFFTSPEQIGNLTSTLPPADGEGKSCFSLLTMSENSKTTFVNKQHGKLMTRDVAVKTVTFYDHLLVAPAIDLAETKRMLEKKALEIFSATAMEQIEEKKTELIELRERKARIQSMIRIVRGKNHAFSNFTTIELDKRKKLEELSQQLNATDSEINDLKSNIGTPRQSLDYLYDVLKTPDKTLSIHQRSLRLDWMNTVMEDQNEGGDTIFFIEFRSGSELRRQGALVRLKYN